MIFVYIIKSMENSPAGQSGHGCSSGIYLLSVNVSSLIDPMDGVELCFNWQTTFSWKIWSAGGKPLDCWTSVDGKYGGSAKEPGKALSCSSGQDFICI